jgi:hypothetical protein
VYITNNTGMNILYGIYQDPLPNQTIYLVLPIAKSRFLYLRRIIIIKNRSLDTDRVNPDLQNPDIRNIKPDKDIHDLEE